MSTQRTIPNETFPKTDFSIIASMFLANAQSFEKAIEGIPPEQWLRRPGEDSNHLTWVAGHIVTMRAIVPRFLGLEWSAPWENLFARGARLAAPDEYPDPGEIKRAWHEVSGKLSGALANISTEVLERPVPKEAFSLDGKVGGSIALLSLHETYHVGQAGYLRKWLGYGQAVG
jgi:uncharacterized damage-inducible protein DinB